MAVVIKTVHDRLLAADVTLDLRLHCNACGYPTAVTRRDHPSISDHPGGLWCAECGVFLKWLAKPGTEKRRRATGDMDTVWAEYGNHCACCGLSVEEMQVLGIHRTMQHAPPYCEGGTHLIPFCSWCQQNSASDQVRLKALVKRLADKMTMPYYDTDDEDPFKDEAG